MRLFILIFLIVTNCFGQIPETADSIYYSAKYCNTSETVEDCYEAYTYNANIGCYLAGTYGTALCDALFPEIWIYDSYDCCCKVASAPGSESTWTGFMDSDCPAYLDSIGFIYNDPDYINWTSLDENELILDGIYIDMYGRQHITPPKGLSIKNKKKYFKLKNR